MEIELQKPGEQVNLARSCGNDYINTVKTVPKSDRVQSLEAIFYAPDFVTTPSNVFKAEEYGVKPDGKTINTKPLQATIDAAHEAGGGMVKLPQGVTVCGALFLKSNVELRLDEGVVLQAVQDDAEFPDKWTRIAGIEMDCPASIAKVRAALMGKPYQVNLGGSSRMSITCQAQ